MPDDLPRFRQIWLENIQRLALLSVPAAIGIALVADSFVNAILGETWRPAIVPIQILALNAAVVTFAATSGEVFQALGRPQLRVVAEATYLVLVTPALVIGASTHGIVGAAAAVVIVGAVVGVAVVAFLSRLLAVRVAEFGQAIARPALGWGVMAASMLAASAGLDGQSAAVSLVVLVFVGVAAYVAVVAVVARDIVGTMWVNFRGARPDGGSSSA